MKLSRCFDAHVHLRQGDMLRAVARHTDRVCSGCLVMPNVVPRVDTSAGLLPELRSAGAAAGKLYPNGVTHNSDGGPTRSQLITGKFDDAMRQMADLGIPLCVHGEVPGACCLDAEEEEEFLPLLDRRQRTGAKPVLENISTAAAVRRVRAGGLHASSPRRSSWSSSPTRSTVTACLAS